MKKPRTLQFAAAGAFIALMLAVAGQRMDSAIPAISLEHQVLYNWLALILSPGSFLLRLTNPDAPIVPSVSFAATIIALNALWYGAARQVYLVVAGPANARGTAPALATVAGSSISLASRRSTPSERLADYEHRLSAEADGSISHDAESTVLAGSSSR
jgi:hypothetical protein